MEFTLTYQGPLPAKQRGVSPVKARLREAFHPQIKAALEPRLSPKSRPLTTETVYGSEFVTPAIESLSTAVELHVLLLSPPTQRIGDVDNRLKTLVDGLTRPANPEQMQGFSAPHEGGPTFCLLSDDRLVQRVNLDTRAWHGATGPNESLVVVTAKVVLSSAVTVHSSMSSLFLLV